MSVCCGLSLGIGEVDMATACRASVRTGVTVPASRAAIHDSRNDETT
jgi:hypothetical protein